VWGVSDYLGDGERGVSDVAADPPEEDPDFPGDNDELMFYYTWEVSVAEINRTDEGMEAKGATAMDQGQLDDLIGDNGILCNGLRAAAPGVADKHSAAFAEGMSNLVATDGTGGKTKLLKLKDLQKEEDKKKADEERKKAENVDEDDPKEIAASRLEDIQKDIRDARQYSLVLDSKNVCRETAAGLDTFADTLTDIHKRLTTLTETRGATPAQFLDIFEEADLQQGWFEKAGSRAKRLCSASKDKVDACSALQQTRSNWYFQP